jgi:hypothetical protein
LFTCSGENEIELRVSRRNKVVTTISPDAEYPDLYSMMAISRIFEGRGWSLLLKKGKKVYVIMGCWKMEEEELIIQPRAGT